MEILTSPLPPELKTELDAWEAASDEDMAALEQNLSPVKLHRVEPSDTSDRYPLRGTILEYKDPTGPIFSEESEITDWIAASRPALQEVWDNDDDPAYDQ